MGIEVGTKNISDNYSPALNQKLSKLENKAIFSNQMIRDVSKSLILHQRP
jgi:hypothetical protein